MFSRVFRLRLRGSARVELLSRKGKSVQPDATSCNEIRECAKRTQSAWSFATGVIPGIAWSAADVPKCSGMFHGAECAKRTHFAKNGRFPMWDNHLQPSPRAELP